MNEAAPLTTHSRNGAVPSRRRSVGPWGWASLPLQGLLTAFALGLLLYQSFVIVPSLSEAAAALKAERENQAEHAKAERAAEVEHARLMLNVRRHERDTAAELFAVQQESLRLAKELKKALGAAEE